jgi:hypothetical protein
MDMEETLPQPVPTPAYSMTLWWVITGLYAEEISYENTLPCEARWLDLWSNITTDRDIPASQYDDVDDGHGYQVNHLRLEGRRFTRRGERDRDRSHR